jgi:hypothetical protein
LHIEYIHSYYLRLRRDLKDSIAGQLFPLDLDTKLNESDLINKNESLIAIKNLEQQLNLIKKERDNSMQMWQHSLSLISQLETELKVINNYFTTLKLSIYLVNLFLF